MMSAGLRLSCSNVPGHARYCEAANEGVTETTSCRHAAEATNLVATPQIQQNGRSGMSQQFPAFEGATGWGEARERSELPCPCCGARLSLRGQNGTMRLEADTQGYMLPAAAGTMFIDPHAHMISRTTADYEAMARAGVVAVIEPSFWLGQPRTNLGSYVDYLSTILGFEKFRAGPFGIRHYCCIGLNPKEANNTALAEAVLEVLPHFAVKESVVALGELGYDEQTPEEDKYLRLQIDLAKELDLPIMIHTPHRDKHRGTLRTMDVLAE